MTLGGGVMEGIDWLRGGREHRRGRKIKKRIYEEGREGWTRGEEGEGKGELECRGKDCLEEGERAPERVKAKQRMCKRKEREGEREKKKAIKKNTKTERKVGQEKG